MTKKVAKKGQGNVRTRSRFTNAAVLAGIASQAGKGAVKGEYRAAITLHESWSHTESVDLDTHFVDAEPNSARWDYGVGVKNGDAELAFWIEPHPASSTGEVKRLIEKVKWLKGKLNSPAFKQFRNLTDDTVQSGHIPYRWLHAGSLQIVRGSKEAKLLALAGIDLPCRHLKLPS